MWIIKAFMIGATFLIFLIVITTGYVKLEEFLTRKYGSDAMTLFWAFIITSLILGTFLLKLIEAFK